MIESSEAMHEHADPLANATILAGTNSSGSAQTVSMQWRTQTLTERASPQLISDIVRVSGMSVDIGGQPARWCCK